MIKDKLNTQSALPVIILKQNNSRQALITLDQSVSIPRDWECLSLSCSDADIRSRLMDVWCHLTPPCTPDVSLTNIRAASPLPDQLIARVIPRVRLNVSIIRRDDDVSSSKKNKKYEPSLIDLQGRSDNMSCFVWRLLEALKIDLQIKVGWVLKNLGNSLFDGHWDIWIWTIGSWDNWV